MSIHLAVGSSDPVEVKALTDLEQEIDSYFDLGMEFAEYLDKPVASLPANLRTTSLSYTSGNQAWTPGEFTFTLCGGITGKITVISSGTLMEYMDEFPMDVTISLNPVVVKNTTKSIAVPDNTAYVCVELDLQIGGGFSAQPTWGIYGVCGSASSKDSFAVSFYKRCKPTDVLRDAIGDAFAGLVLPLHADTYTHLAVGDYLHHTFNANLQVGLGASIGVDKVLYAGQSTAAFPGTTGAVALKATLKPEVEAEANLAFQFEYAGTFEALLWKIDERTGGLHLYRSQMQDTSLGLHVGVTLDAGLSVRGKVMESQLAKAMGRVLPGAPGAAVIPLAADEISSCVTDGNKALAAWLGKRDQAKAALDFAIESTNQTFLLLDYTLDLTAQAFAAAWKLALDGKYVDALGTAGGGVSIAVGSGLEKFYSRKTSITLNLFGLWKADWSDALLHNSSMVYAGNNIFHLVVDVGRQSLDTVNKGKREIDLYFAAEADMSGASTVLQTVNLHVLLQATNDTKFGRYIAKFLQLLAVGEGSAALVKGVADLAGQANTTQMVHAVLGPTAYQRLNASTTTHGKLGNESPDRDNYAAFARACKELIAEDPGSFSFQGQELSYEVWRNWNIASTDQWPARPGAMPNRLTAGNSQAGIAQLQLQFPQGGGTTTLVGYALQAASDFMNFCEQLKGLALDVETNAAGMKWDALVKALESLMTKDVKQDFVVPTSLALVRLCGSVPDEVTGPVAGVESSVAVTVTYR